MLSTGFGGSIIFGGFFRPFYPCTYDFFIRNSLGGGSFWLSLVLPLGMLRIGVVILSEVSFILLFYSVFVFSVCPVSGGGGGVGSTDGSCPSLGIRYFFFSVAFPVGDIGSGGASRFSF